MYQQLSWWAELGTGFVVVFPNGTYTFLLASPETLRATHRLFGAQANVQNPCVPLKRKLQAPALLC